MEAPDEWVGEVPVDESTASPTGPIGSGGGQVTRCDVAAARSRLRELTPPAGSGSVESGQRLRGLQ